MQENEIKSALKDSTELLNYLKTLPLSKVINKAIRDCIAINNKLLK